MDRDEQRLAEQVLESYRQLPVSLLVNIVNSLILAGVLSSHVATSRIVPWVLLIMTVTGLRYGLLRAYSRHGQRGGDSQRWANGLRLGACAAGTGWGLAGIVLFPAESVAHQVFLAFMIGGMAAGAVPLLSILKGAYPCFLLPALVPISIRSMASGDDLHLMMGAMGLIFVAAMLFASRQLHRAVSESITLRFELADSRAKGERLARIANSDALTGIANRRSFNEVLEDEWRRALRNGSHVSMILGDIDHFKAYNDRYGHMAGDDCLREVAQAVARAVHRPADLVARIGGEEFGVLLPETPLSGASKVAEDMRRAVAALGIGHEGSGPSGQVTMSLGVATLVPQDRLSPTTLFERTDQALYRAKRQGRNRVELDRAPTPPRAMPRRSRPPLDVAARAADTPPGRRTG